MAKPLLPYGSKNHLGLMVKEGGQGKLADRSSALLASQAFAGSHGQLAKGGWGKLSELDTESTRLVRLNRKGG